MNICIEGSSNGRGVSFGSYYPNSEDKKLASLAKEIYYRAYDELKAVEIPFEDTFSIADAWDHFTPIFDKMDNALSASGICLVYCFPDGNDIVSAEWIFELLSDLKEDEWGQCA